MKFRVDLDIFRGPMDLLHYLVRKHELDILDIPIGIVTEQYLEYLDVLEQLDINAVGDFIDVASALIEIKSKLVLPRAEEVDQPMEDPRDQLVERLLEYKKYKDAASILEERSLQWQQRFPRVACDLPPRKIDPADQPIHEVELWDLVSALGRVMREHDAAKPANIVYDDTPIQSYMQQIHDRLNAKQRMAFSEMFSAGMHKSAMIGVFLAILELVRHHCVQAEQGDSHGEIWVSPSENFAESLDLGDVDNYDENSE
jgi:segregation and condensation protein A